ncbi:MAG: S1C family serine protease [Actinobacteria bacterium]|nr:S1C family serine protease [Actinomycetota bacterium]
MERGDDDGTDDAGDDFAAPLPPDDRLWRHPSEVARPARGRADARPASARSSWSVALVSGLVGSVFTLGMVAATGAFDRRVGSAIVRETVPSAVSSQVLPGASGTTSNVVRIAEDVSPAITRIQVGGATRATGSGVLFRDDGHVMTNAHVVDGGGPIDVVLADGSQLPGRLLGSDQLTDVAVVKIDRSQRFPVAALGSAAGLRVGQPTVAIGSPLGLIGGSSVTTGVVSALGRRLEGGDGPPLLDMIQTDAAIAPGSSGGALLDEAGAVIGITTAIAVSEEGYQGLGFATPVDIARSVAEDIIATGRAAHVWLGIEGRDLDAESARRKGIAGGAVVVETVAGSPAEDAGLRPDDVVVAVADREVGSMSALVIALRERDPGDEVDLGILRAGERLTVAVELGSRPSS